MNDSTLNEISIEVFIPTYNRPIRAEQQIKSLVSLRNMLKDVGFKLNILVSDNHSSIPVSIPASASDFTKIIRPEKHLPTAEENLFFGLSQTSSEYIWILGDDDSIITNSAFEMITSLRSNPVDLIISNSSGSLTNGDFIKSRTPCDYPEFVDGLPSFIKSTGFWFVIAGFSCLLLKREPALKNLSISKTYFSISRIYSHVFWLLDTFWDSRFRYFEKPIVIYGQNPTDVAVGNHWEKACHKEGVFYKFIWTLGFVRHAELLRERKNIPQGYYSNVLDQNWSTRFHHLSQCMNVFLEILEAEIKEVKSICRSITSEEKSEFLVFVSSEDSRLSDITSLLLNSLNKTTLADVRMARLMLDKFIGENFYNCFFIKDFACWNIYGFDEVYRAVPVGLEKYFTKEFHNIYPATTNGHIVAKSIKEIESLILENKFSPPFLSSRSSEELLSRDIKLLKRLLYFVRTLKRLLPISLISKIKVKKSTSRN